MPQSKVWRKMVNPHRLHIKHDRTNRRCSSVKVTLYCIVCSRRSSPCRSVAMRFLSAIVTAATTLLAGAALAQGVDLTGRYLCVQGCAAPGQVAFVTQNGWNLNLTNEVGEPSRAWIDWYGHLWAQQWNEGRSE